jgi:hypothetical protein
MSFSERFIEVSTSLFDKRLAETVGYNSQSKECDAIVKINPFEISHYRECFEDETKELCHTVIYFKSGESIEIDMTIHDFEKLLNKFS